jgi:hypothetical protein
VKASFWRSGVLRSMQARLLVIALLLILIVSLVATGWRPAPSAPAKTDDRFVGAVAANLTNGTDPATPA